MWSLRWAGESGVWCWVTGTERASRAGRSRWWSTPSWFTLTSPSTRTMLVILEQSLDSLLPDTPTSTLYSFPHFPISPRPACAERLSSPSPPESCCPSLIEAPPLPPSPHPGLPSAACPAHAGRLCGTEVSARRSWRCAAVWRQVRGDWLGPDHTGGRAGGPAAPGGAPHPTQHRLQPGVRAAVRGGDNQRPHLRRAGPRHRHRNLRGE